MTPPSSTRAIALIALLASGTALHATDGTWTLNNNGNWSTAANWSGSTIADGTDANVYLSNIITGNRTITLDGARTIGHIYAQDTSNNYTISGANVLTFDVTSGLSTIDVVSGRSLTISSAVVVNDGLQTTGAGTTSLTGGATLGSSQTWDVTGRLSITGTISDGGNGYGLTKEGSGILQLNGATLSYTGDTVVNGGILLTANNLPSGNMRLNNGILSDYYRATTAISGLGTGAGEIQVYGNSGFGGGNGNSTWRIGSSGSSLVWGALGEGTATGYFNPTSFKLLSAADNMGPSTFGQVTIDNGLDLNSGARTIDVLASTGDPGFYNSWGKINGAITDSGSGGSLIKTGGGNLFLAGTNTYGGGTTINQGVVYFDKIGAMPDSGEVTVNDGAILGIRVGGAGWTNGTSGVGTIGGLLAGDGGAGTSTVSYNGNVGVRLEVGTNTTYSGDIGNVGTTLALHKTGGSSLTLNGNNTYSGGTFLYQGSLIADSATALGSGDITFKGGTLQYTANTAATDFGSQITNSTSAINLNTNGQNVTLSGIAAGNTGGLTKTGNGTLTFTGTNTYSGVTNLNAGAITVYDGTLSTSGGAVSMTASGTSVSILGGSGVSSTWNLGNQQFGTGNSSYSNLQVLIDGNGVAGSAVMTNVNLLVWGRSAVSSTLTVTDGGQMNVNGQVRIGNPYYSEAGGANITIGGGTATSTFTGNSGQDFYIGYGERTGSKDNVVTVSTNGVLTNVRDMYVGHINNGQNNDNPTTNNQLLVSGGTASMRGLSLGYIQTDTKDALANVVSVTSGGQLSTTGAVYVGRANNATSTSNLNTLTVSGTGSSWDAGNQTVYVGHTNNASAQSNGNVLTVGAGASVTNIGSLIVGFGSGTETGNQLVVNGILTASTVTISTGNSLSGSGTINAAVTVFGSLAPGNSPGVLTFGDTMALDSAATIAMEIDGTTRGTGYDGVDVTNALTYGGDMTLTLGTTFGAGSYTFDLFGFGSESGDLNSITLAGNYSGSLVFGGDDWTLTSGTDTWTFTQSTGDLTLNVIPEPGAAMLGLIGALGLLIRRKRA